MKVILEDSAVQNSAARLLLQYYINLTGYTNLLPVLIQSLQSLKWIGTRLCEVPHPAIQSCLGA